MAKKNGTGRVDSAEQEMREVRHLGNQAYFEIVALTGSGRRMLADSENVHRFDAVALRTMLARIETLAGAMTYGLQDVINLRDAPQESLDEVRAVVHG